MVPSSLLWVAQDFSRLESERGVGMGAGPIPVTRMYEYLAWTQTAPDLWEECITYWTAMDRETLQSFAERAEKMAPKSKAKQGGNVVPKEAYPEL